MPAVVRFGTGDDANARERYAVKAATTRMLDDRAILQGVEKRGGMPGRSKQLYYNGGFLDFSQPHVNMLVRQEGQKHIEVPTCTTFNSDVAADALKSAHRSRVGR